MCRFKFSPERPPRFQERIATITDGLLQKMALQEIGTLNGSLPRTTEVCPLLIFILLIFILDTLVTFLLSSAHPEGGGKMAIKDLRDPFNLVAPNPPTVSLHAF